MKLEVSSVIYSLSTILTTVKKQQIFADWQLLERTATTTTLSFSRCVEPKVNEESCVVRFRNQLDDEQIREKLEEDFGSVRDRLVAYALEPIVAVQNKDE